MMNSFQYGAGESRILLQMDAITLLEESSHIEKTLVNNAMTHLELGCTGVPTDRKELELLCRKTYVE